MTHCLYSAPRFTSRGISRDALGLPRPYPAAAEDLPSTHENNFAPVFLAGRCSGERFPQPGPCTCQCATGQQRCIAVRVERLYQQHAPPSNPPDAYARGLGNFARQDFAAAENDLNTWLKLHPNDLQADYLLARTYRNLSLSTLEQLLAVAPDSYPAHQLLAETYQNAQQNDKPWLNTEWLKPSNQIYPGCTSLLGACF